MACTCVRDNEKRLSEHYSKQLETSAEASCVSVAYMLDGGERSFIVYKIQAEKPGWKKGKNTNMFFTFCPFCGVKVEA
jgi:hypothetical protein